MAAPAHAGPRAERQLRRQLRHDVVIALLALVSVGIGVYELVRPRVDTRFTLLDALDLGIVLVFIVDFVAHARRSGDWRRYVRRHWYELPSLIPVTGGLLEGLDGIAVVRGVRLVRLARVVRLLRVIGVAPRLRLARRYLERIADRARLVELTLLGIGFVVGGAALGLAFDRSSFDGFGDAVWWSLNLFTTVAYLEVKPLSAAGRAVAALLMVSGVAFIGVFTASLANAILKEPAETAEDTEPAPPVD